MTLDKLASFADLALASIQQPGGKSNDEKLPKFSGYYGDWSNFWEEFTSLVDNNKGIPTVVKVRRLLAALEGPALLAVKHLSRDKDKDLVMHLDFLYFS